MAGGMWRAAPPPMARFGPREPQGPPMDADRAGRFAALSLLLLAMLLWLFTALLFARHGFYPRSGSSGAAAAAGQPARTACRAGAVRRTLTHALRHDQVPEVVPGAGWPA